MNRFFSRIVVLMIILFESQHLMGQPVDTLVKDAAIFRQQRDLIDIGYLLLHKDPVTRSDSPEAGKSRLHFSVIPIAKYANATGLTVGLGGNVAFSTSMEQGAKLSNIKAEIKFTQKNQFLLPIQSSIWTKRNKFKLAGDWRYQDYPQDTYGFGGHSSLNDVYIVAFKHIRFYEFVLRKIGKDFYFGPGYQFDHHWNISELQVVPGRITDFQKYGFSHSSTSSGLSLNLVYDTRKNSIHPEAGNTYASISFLQNAKMMGANSNWSSLTFDLRKYIAMPFHTVLALWLYNVWTVGGNAPYLDLPGTASDTYNKTGRGYIQNRFSGKHMIDVEAELRFNISKNGLLGGVIFSNAESLSELYSNRFEVISPGIGFGLRFKLNKFSATNICADYGFGIHGSHGFTGSLGEVF